MNGSFLRRFFTHLSSGFLFLTILAGALVHATGSGLACPDWPLCMGQYFPEMTGAVLFEHSHRLIAGTTGIIVWITGLLHLTSSLPFNIKLTSASLMFLIVIQAVLGGLTVLYQLPSWISTLHFLLAHVTFAGMLYLSWYFIDRSSGETHYSTSNIERLFGGASLLTLFFQMGLGAWLRHIGSKGAPPMPVCKNFPWCDPLWISTMTQNYLLTYWTHRYVAVAVTLFITGTTLVVLRRKQTDSIDATICYWASLMTLLQIVLGVLTVRSSLSVLMTMFHTGGALIIFTLLLWLNFRSQAILGSPENA